MNDAHRKARLRHLIKTDYGDRKAFMEATGVSKGRLSQMLGKEPFGEKAANNLQEELGLPAGWFSLNEPTPKEHARKPAVASQSTPINWNADAQPAPAWPLTREVMAALAALDGEGRRKAENVLRSHLDLPQLPRAENEKAA